MTVAARIIALFGTQTDERTLSVASIAEAIGGPRGTVYTLLKRLVKTGDLVRARYGQYHLPGVVPIATPTLNLASVLQYVRRLEERIAALEAGHAR